MKRLRIIFPSLVLFSCADAPTTTAGDPLSSQTVHTNASDTIAHTRPVVLSGCYTMISNKDTATLEISVRDTTVSGSLQYHWREKDWNTGRIQGVLRNDQIHADYTFESEGMTSVREVVFKIEDSTLQEGTGELVQQNNKIVFRNKDQLQFHTIHPFIKVACGP